MDNSWRADAVCAADGYAGLFFPEVGEGPQIQVAKAICNSCIVKDACLEFALETKQHHGIWGGTTEKERRRIRARARRNLQPVR